MKSIVVWIQLAALTLISLSVGCNDESFQLAEVSGTITLDGTPLTGAVVVFMPEPKPGNSVVGPFSSGTTNAKGRFTLKTRYGDPGAVVGTHVVTVEYDDVDPLAIQRLLNPSAGPSRSEYDEPSNNADGIDDGIHKPLSEDSMEPQISVQPSVVDESKLGTSRQSLAAKLNGRRLIPPRYSLEPILKFSVPASGSTSANFDLESEPSVAEVVK